MTETFVTPSKAYLELQGRMATALLEAADESLTRAEQSARESATTFANAIHAQMERSIDAMSVSTKLRARAVGIAREAWTAAVPASK